MAQQEQELEFAGDFDPEDLEDSEDDQIRYVFDPDTNQDEEVIYDPARRRRRKPKTRTRWRTKVKRVYVRAKKKLRPKKSWMGWQTMMAIPIALVSFIISMQQDTMAWYVEKMPDKIKDSFSIPELLKTLGGGWGRPKDIIAYIKNVFTSPMGLGGLALAVYGILPFKRLPLKKIALISGGAMLIGSLLGSALHASGEEPQSNQPYSGRGTISEKEAYSHVLMNDPFNR